MRISVPLAAAFMVLGACSSSGRKEPEPDSPGACSLAAVASCVEYVQLADPARERRGCEAMGGAWGQACPANPRLGTCSGIALPGGTMNNLYYPGVGSPPSLLASGCASIGGTWTAGTATEGPATQQSVSCDGRPAAPCSDIEGMMSPETRQLAESNCRANGATVLSSGSCPVTGRSGTCTFRIIGNLMLRNRYYAPGSAAADRAACEGDDGVWEPD